MSVCVSVGKIVDFGMLMLWSYYICVRSIMM